MSDILFEDARRRLKADGACSFDVPRNAQFDWMQSQCFLLTGGRLKIMGARTITAQVRILPIGEDRVIIWDYDHLAQTEYLHFLLQFDNDDQLNSLAHFALYRFAARLLLATGHIIHSAQFLRGAQRAAANVADIEACQRREKPYDSAPIAISGYLLFFHEMAHYIFRKPSAGRERCFQQAADRIEELRKKAERSLEENDFRSIRGPRGPAPFPGSEADGVYPRNLVEYLNKHQESPLFIEEVACDLFAIEQLLKSYRTKSAPEAVAHRYSAVMMHYQIQATLEGLRRRYEEIEHPEDSINIEANTGNQIRNDIRGFYFRDKISEILNPEPSFWPAYTAEVRRVYDNGVRERYWRLVVPAGAVVMAKAYDEAWLAECDRRDATLNSDQRKQIRNELAANFSLRFG